MNNNNNNHINNNNHHNNNDNNKIYNSINDIYAGFSIIHLYRTFVLGGGGYQVIGHKLHNLQSEQVRDLNYHWFIELTIFILEYLSYE